MSDYNSSEINDLLQRGIDSLRAGRKANARDLLTQVVDKDESNEMGWLWLSGAVDSDRERVDCLRNVLEINPSNSAARKGLRRLLTSKDSRVLTVASKDERPGSKLAKQQTTLEIGEARPQYRREVHPKTEEGKTRSNRKLLFLGTCAILLVVGSLFIAPKLLKRSSEEIANHVAWYSGTSDDLDEWCEGFAMLGYGDRIDETKWTATKSVFSTSNMWTVECRAGIVDITSDGKKVHYEPIMTMLYDEGEGYIYFKTILGQTSMEHLEMLSWGGFSIRDILGSPRVWAPMD